MKCQQSPKNSTATTTTATGEMRHRLVKVFGNQLSVFISCDGMEHLVGVQLASVLKRETFNMYRSMKIKEIPVLRANPRELEFLVKIKAVRTGTHSVSLVPYSKGLYFLADSLDKAPQFLPLESGTAGAGKKRKRPSKKRRNRAQPLQRKVSYLTAQPTIHRRKPLPWNVHRSLRAKEFRRIVRADAERAIRASKKLALSSSLAAVAAVDAAVQHVDDVSAAIVVDTPVISTAAMALADVVAAHSHSHSSSSSIQMPSKPCGPSRTTSLPPPPQKLRLDLLTAAAVHSNVATVPHTPDHHEEPPYGHAGLGAVFAAASSYGMFTSSQSHSPSMSPPSFALSPPNRTSSQSHSLLSPTAVHSDVVSAYFSGYQHSTPTTTATHSAPIF
eukprot:CAMPEP_0174234776 /NCGR_PEP_ID=MMETSP0417-20130205/4432_1 /TAXON_ID=242541 /ORGANISM="Mayorella sp, Strain BSH-02190019" /LENGTH=386 /DNA_ID=CAMNT_0015313187 /DNA_START=275 /DNA_END=1435 /DNA_ORIENTATION=+